MSSRIRRLGVIAATTLALAAPPMTGALAEVITPDTPRSGSLTKVGPIADNGFPAWYKDSNGVRLEACTTLDDPYCAITPDTLPDPEAPIVFPTNYPDEFFYQLASGALTTQGNVDVDVIMDLEGAFAVGAPAEGDQVVFGRIRIRAKDAPDGVTWRITHPYGVDQFTTSNGDGINMTEDIGLSPQAFGGALKSRVGPFLTWDPSIAPAAPTGYIGDPNVNHAVVGSPYDTNFIRVEQQNADGTWSEIGSTDQFSIQGKIATNTGVDVQQATYSLDAAGQGVVEVWASTEPDKAIQVTGEPGIGFATTALTGQDGRYYGRLPVTGDIVSGETIEVVNASDQPVAKRSVKLVDKVLVSAAAYDATAHTLTVTAQSSDQESDSSLPELSVDGFGPMTAATTTYSDIVAPPPTVTVTSTAGGSTTMPLATTGDTLQASAPVAAILGPDTAQVGQPVTFDGSASSGDISSYTWDVSGLPGNPTVTGLDTASITFTPAQEGSYTVGLTVDGPAGPSVQATRTVVVGATAATDLVVGPDQVVRRGTRVTLDASQTTGARSLLWQQTSGTPVTLSDPAAMSPTFTFPLMALPGTGDNAGYVYNNDPLVFTVTATGIDGVSTSTKTVTVSPEPEQITGLSIRYRTRGEWRVSGTSSIRAGQKIAIMLGSQPTGRLVGTASVDTTGAFSYRGSVAGPGQDRTLTILSATGGQALGTINVTS